MENVPFLFYDHLLQLVDNRADFAELPNPIGRLAKSYLSERYKVIAYISDNFYVQVCRNEGDPQPWEDSCSMSTKVKYITEFRVKVFDAPEREEHRDKYKVSREAFQRVMNVFLRSRHRTVRFGCVSGPEKEERLQAQIANFHTFKKHLISCHDLRCYFYRHYDLLKDFYGEVLPEFIRSPNLSILRLREIGVWSSATLESIFDFLRSPNARFFYYSADSLASCMFPGGLYSQYALFMKWMDEEDVPSKKIMDVSLPCSISFLNNFDLQEIGRDSIEGHSEWAEKRIQGLEREDAEAPPLPGEEDFQWYSIKWRFFHLQHPKSEANSLIVSVCLTDMAARKTEEEMTKRKLFSTKDSCTVYFL
ncbi:hypothetical protein QR680_014216 [Steinernema hermaphroditum]|nr:hypothetical protein QR680_014216 [Steinernema hermaphroditum]